MVSRSGRVFASFNVADPRAGDLVEVGTLLNPDEVNTAVYSGDAR